MSLTQEFDVVLERQPDQDAAYVTVPFDVPEVYGKKGQVKVRVTIDGYPYRGSIAPMGGGVHVLGVKKEIRAAIDKGPGDTVHVVMQADTAERRITLPDEFKRALDKNKNARTFFDSLSYTHRKEYAQWIASAKKSETRAARLKKSIAMLTAGVKHP